MSAMTTDPTVLLSTELSDLQDFVRSSDRQLGIIERKPPAEADDFFRSLLSESEDFAEVLAKVRLGTAREDIETALQDAFPASFQSSPFYETWLQDMAAVTDQFCKTIGEDSATFTVGRIRSCVRYHIDSVPFRLLVTYHGAGTEWIPEGAADRDAFANFEGNEKILKDPSAVQNVGVWDATIFRGEPDQEQWRKRGVLHRTPDAVMNGDTMMMRLDLPHYYELFSANDEELEEMLGDLDVDEPLPDKGEGEDGENLDVRTEVGNATVDKPLP